MISATGMGSPRERLQALPQSGGESGKATPRQMAVLNFIRDFFEDNDQFPTAQLIADHFGFQSGNAATCHLVALERKGYIERNVMWLGNSNEGRGFKSYEQAGDNDG